MQIVTTLMKVFGTIREEQKLTIYEVLKGGMQASNGECTVRWTVAGNAELRRGSLSMELKNCSPKISRVGAEVLFKRSIENLVPSWIPIEGWVKD